MEVAILQQGAPIGTLTTEPDGLFLRFDCRITQAPEQLRRIYLLSGWDSVYLGIPDAGGCLRGRMALRHLPEPITGAVACREPRDLWHPWCGVLEGVAVEEGWVRREEEAILLALPPREAAKFPDWEPVMTKDKVRSTEMAVVALGPEGQPPMIEKELGGTITNDETSTGDDSAAGVPADGAADPEPCSDPPFCGPDAGDFRFLDDTLDGWEADCTDL